MMTASSHCSFSFDIVEWQASSSRLAGLGAWQQWSADTAFVESQPDYKPELAFLPAMQRRRLGRAARLVCDAAWNLAEKHPESILVFASHDGELNRSFELWLELMKTHTVSPTSFGLSVHNAQVGQWSMLRKDMRENTALAVGSDGLETALAEAYALMQEGAEQVLLVVADDPLSEEYALEAERAPMPYALAMVLRPGRQYHLALSCGKDAEKNSPYWGALDWIRFMLSDRHEETRYYGKRRWLWQKAL
ncbi:beta-ketoacyl synthase chain length factor [Neisseria wadsworthii]|uniref:beta-ketoacyl synthase chain length factor n=1 Tax=Neisseria wadsworthii TaxID=607711 RepID=UPI000D311B4B|nr:beta-ketoacyl synthase chain length factor [Neisseria wadsworthii]